MTERDSARFSYSRERPNDTRCWRGADGCERLGCKRCRSTSRKTSTTGNSFVTRYTLAYRYTPRMVREKYDPTEAAVSNSSGACPRRRTARTRSPLRRRDWRPQVRGLPRGRAAWEGGRCRGAGRRSTPPHVRQEHATCREQGSPEKRSPTSCQPTAPEGRNAIRGGAALDGGESARDALARREREVPRSTRRPRSGATW